MFLVFAPLNGLGVSFVYSYFSSFCEARACSLGIIQPTSVVVRGAGCEMNTNEQRFEELCKQATVEQDAQKLAALVAEIIRLLAARDPNMSSCPQEAS